MGNTTDSHRCIVPVLLDKLSSIATRCYTLRIIELIESFANNGGNSMTDYTAYEVPATNVNQLPVMHPGRPVGRDDLLKEIINHLQSRRAVQLVGEAGIGKTALAAALSAAFVQQSGVIWLANGTHPFPELLVRVGRALGLEDVIQSEQPAGRVGIVATAITNKKPFIVLDNVEDALAPKQFIDKCAENMPLLLLTETELTGPWETVHVDQLADLDAVVLFKQNRASHPMTTTLIFTASPN